MKVLINAPKSSYGGVAIHYNGLRDYWTEDVSYNYVGGRHGIPGWIILIYDYIKFFFLCLFFKYDTIILNPSLGRTAIIRDAMFLKIAKWFDRKVVVFFHGWHPDMVSKINKNNAYFYSRFHKADAFFVLSSSFKNDLQRWRIIKPIYIVTTKVDDGLLKNFEIHQKRYNRTILFLSRIEEYKGIYIVLDAYKKVLAKMDDAKLIIAGDGSQLNKAKEYVVTNSIEGVSFLGNVSSEALVNAFTSADLYILPSYSEGMPASVLEAMAFGLPIISRPVGGVVDFFEEEKMGYLIESLDPEDYATKLFELLNDEKKLKKTGYYNHLYSKEHFLASKVTKNVENILLNIKD